MTTQLPLGLIPTFLVPLLLKLGAQPHKALR